MQRALSMSPLNKDAAAGLERMEKIMKGIDPDSQPNDVDGGMDSDDFQQQ